MLYDAINYSAQVNEKTKNTEKYENKIQILKKLQKNFYRDGIQMIALSQLLLLLYILAMTDGMRQKAFRRCFLRQMNPFKEFLPDYKLHLISCNNISDFTKFHTEFGRLMHILKVISDEEQMDILLSDPGYSALSVTAAQIINTFTGLHFSIPEKEDTINMRNAWTDHKESGRREGFNEATTSYTQRMYKAGIPLEVIAEVIEKPVTEVEKYCLTI